MLTRLEIGENERYAIQCDRATGLFKTPRNPTLQRVPRWESYPKTYAEGTSFATSEQVDSSN